MDIQELVRDYTHNYVQQIMRNMLGDAVYVLLTVVLALIGLALLLIAISDSNAILGNPLYRDKSSMNDLKYEKMRMKLRIVLGVVGAVLLLYNVLALM